MTSSTSSALVSPKKHDVFISFSEDTRRKFTSHLHAALRRKYIDTYIVDKRDKGDEVGPSLFNDIKDSALYLIVFSENYASSRRCLNELAKIVEYSKHQVHRIIPVFYEIDPSDVRKQTGSYQMAFSQHEQTNHKQLVLKWKDPLTHVANLSGWDSSLYEDEAELIGHIVEDVLEKLDFKFINQIIGIHEQIVYLESLLCRESLNVRSVGIWGLGGIGKTTIAMVLFKKLHSKFESSCFLANVREELEEHGITYLKTKLSSILQEDEKPNVGMPVGGSPNVLWTLQQKKVLVVLDDVNDSEQVKHLLGVHHWFGQGIRVIVTSRDKQVLIESVDVIHEVKALDLHDSVKLFSLNAFKNKVPVLGFEEPSTKVVTYARGMPLALKVLGSLLCDKGKEYWNCLLENLRKIPYTEILQILRLSYDGLDYEEKNVFLDIACFFKGTRVKQVEMLLNPCGYSTSIGLKRLQDKALLTIYDEKVYMHDMIQEMGWEIVRQECLKDPRKRSRLWYHEDIYAVLKNNKGSEAIIGISLDASKIKELELHPQVFAKMPRLKFLKIYDSTSEEHHLYLPQGTLEFLSNELRYLRWDKCPLKCLPLTFSAENLVELDMQHSKLRKLWDGVQNLVNLKSINLSGSKDLIELPDFSKALNLEEVYLKNCSSLHKVNSKHIICSESKHPRMLSDFPLYHPKGTHESLSNEPRYLGWDECRLMSLLSPFPAENLVELDMQNRKRRKLWDGVQNLVNLKYINLSGSKNLMELPDFSKALNLEEAFLSGCSSLCKVHPSILSLHKLEVLVLDWCEALSSLRSDIHLRSLRYLSLYKCSRLKEFSVTSENMITLNLVKTAINELPSSICCMSKLELLNLSECKRLKNLLSNLFDSLRSLRWLWLDDCCNIFELLDNINIMSSLDRLTINGIAMGRLPPSIKRLSSLKFLLFNRCRRLQCLPELPPSIRALSATDCLSLETVTSVAIECTRFENCVKLDEYSVKAILAYVMVLINKSLSGLENFSPEYNPASIMYLESRLPNWFKYRTTHAGSITIDLSSAPLYMDWGLLFCFIFSPSQTKEIGHIQCTGYLRIINDESVDEGNDDDGDAGDNDNDICNVFNQVDATNFTSDHVFLCYNDDFCSILRQNIRESKAMDGSKLLYKINVLLLDNDRKKWQKHCKEIKECGVCPTYVLEYQN